MPRRPATRRVLAAASSAWIAIGLATSPGCGLSNGRPPGDVVVILIDTLRPDHLGFYGYGRETAPFLAGWARDGAVFLRAHSTSSWTAPATASLFTGLFPTGHGVTEGFFAYRGRMEELAEGGHPVLPLNRLPSSVPTLAERFRSAGYRTYGAASNVNIGPHIGFDRGFDRFAYARKEPAERLLERVGEWRDEMLASPEPTFLYLHLNDVHWPYEQHERWYRSPEADDPTAKRIAAYDSQIGYVDHHLAALARSLGWGPDTLVAVVSDHGEAFGEHGVLRHDGGLHRELTRVLMLFHGPGVPAVRVATDVSLVDVLPTLAELAGLPAAGAPVGAPASDGRSLVPLMQEDAPDGEREAFAARTLLAHRAMKHEDFGRHWWAVLRDGWKLIVDPEGAALYDQQRDFGEEHDLAAAEPERTRALEAELDRLRADGFHREAEVSAVPLDAELLDALERLGYVEEDAPPQGSAAPPEGSAAHPEGHAAPPEGHAAPPEGSAAGPE